MCGAPVYEVNPDAVDLDPEVFELVQLLLLRPPVELISPIGQ
jgi:hypothetical protein